MKLTGRRYKITLRTVIHDFNLLRIQDDVWNDYNKLKLRILAASAIFWQGSFIPIR